MKKHRKVSFLSFEAIEVYNDLEGFLEKKFNSMFNAVKHTIIRWLIRANIYNFIIKSAKYNQN